MKKISQKLTRLLNGKSFDRPKTAAMYNFLEKEAPWRVVGLSIEPDGVFIYTNSDEWQDDAGAGTWRQDSETAAIKGFYETVQPGPNVKESTDYRQKNPLKSLSDLTAGQLNKRLDSISKKSSKITEEFIRAGRGSEKPGEIWHMSDPLAQKYKVNSVEYNNVQDEITRRYGPGMRRAPMKRNITTRRKNPTARKLLPGQTNHYYLQDQATGQYFYRGYPSKKVPLAYGGFKAATEALQRLIAANKKDKTSKWDLSQVKIISTGDVDFSKVENNPVKRKIRHYIIFNWSPRGKALSFLHATNTWVSKFKAVRFSTRKHALQIAKTASKFSSDLIGIAPDDMTPAQIVADIKRKVK